MKFFGIFKNESVCITGAITFSIVSSIILVLGFSFIIWFERFSSDKKRTLINQITSVICMVIIIYATLVQGLYSIQFAVGYLPYFICILLTLSKKVLQSILVLLFDAIILIRYIFIFKLKNPAAFKEDFWLVFLLQFVFGFALGLQWVRYFIPGSQLFELYFCLRLDATELMKLKPVLRGILEVASLAIHLVLGLKILIFKHHNNTTTAPVANCVNKKNKYLDEMNNRSLTNITMSIFVVTMVLVGILTSVLFFSEGHSKTYSTGFKCTLAISNLVVVNVSALVFMVWQFKKNSLMRKALFRLIKDLVSNINFIR